MSFTNVIVRIVGKRQRFTAMLNLQLLIYFFTSNISSVGKVGTLRRKLRSVTTDAEGNEVGFPETLSLRLKYKRKKKYVDAPLIHNFNSTDV